MILVAPSAISIAGSGVALAAEPSTKNSAFSFSIPNSITGLIDATSKAWRGKAAKPQYSRTRFVIGLEGAAKFQVFSLSRPNRVVVEIPNVKLLLPSQPRDAKSGLITSFRSGVAAKNKVRIVINVAAPVIVENTLLMKTAVGQSGHVLSLDIVPVVQRSRAVVLAAMKSRVSGLGAGGVATFRLMQPPSPRPAQTSKQLRARSFKPVIVIDPGHGGRDSGAEKYGVQEKDAVLAFSLMLRAKLMATGRYRVLMTRNKDVFVTLNGRRKFADKNKAALFIAVHADYASTNASGATVYSLRERVARRLKLSAKRDVTRNALGSTERRALHASAPGARIVRGILADLASREVDVTRHRTDLFTKAVIRQMGKSTLLRSQPHRSAAFKVIKTAKMPSVLIELAYVSNRRDARRLQSRRWRSKVSGSIVLAVDNYFSHSLSRVPM